MKNTIVIDATRNCICDLVSAVDNGENRFFIEIRADTALNPKLQIENEQITITGSTFLYEVGTAYYIGDETLQFRIVDDENVGEYFSIEKIAKVDGNLFLTQESNYIYTLLDVVQSMGDIPIATTERLGGIIVGSTLCITSSGVLDVLSGEIAMPITTEELERILV